MLAHSVSRLFSKTVPGSTRILSSNRIRINCVNRWWSTKSQDLNKIQVPAIPRDKLQFSFTASSGPGGQNVNHVNTKVELRFKPAEAHWIPFEMRQRFIDLNANRINKEGEMIITSQRERKQEQNLEDCVSKLKQYLKEASFIPKERIATEVPEHENEKRLKVCNFVQSTFFVLNSSPKRAILANTNFLTFFIPKDQKGKIKHQTKSVKKF